MNLSHLRPHFWEKVTRLGSDDCWLWMQSCGSHGYGQTWDGETVLLAHRVAYELAVGPIPAGMTVDHVCHIRRCCNPSHLRLLSNLENATDNRAVRGEAHTRAKLTECEVRLIRRLHAQGDNTQVLADRFGVTRGTIGPLLQGKTWKHVK